MEYEELVAVEALVVLAVLACPIGMGLMMWFMAKGMGGHRRTRGEPLDQLRAEHERLGGEIERLEANSNGGRPPFGLVH